LEAVVVRFVIKINLWPSISFLIAVLCYFIFAFTITETKPVVWCKLFEREH
jgi:accessory gene regulator protein AgrB